MLQCVCVVGTSRQLCAGTECQCGSVQRGRKGGGVIDTRWKGNLGRLPRGGVLNTQLNLADRRSCKLLEQKGGVRNLQNSMGFPRTPCERSTKTKTAERQLKPFPPDRNTSAFASSSPTPNPSGLMSTHTPCGQTRRPSMVPPSDRGREAQRAP